MSIIQSSAGALMVNRFPPAYTLNDGSTTDYHGSIVADVTGEIVSFLSKYSERGSGEGHKTATSIIRISEAAPPKITDS